MQDIPVLNAGSDAAGFLNTQQLFDADAEQSYGNFVEFGWDFDGDTTAGWDSVFTENSAILYSYTSVGNYTALFYALDDDGNRVVDTRRMNITNPEAGSHPPQILTWTDRDTTVSIKDSVSFALTLFSDGGGNDDVKHFMWDLDGDGNYEIDLSGNASVGYRYPSAGVFTISLKLVDSNNDTNRVQSTITVLQGSPDAGTCTTADGYINTPSISMGTCGAVDDHTSGISGSIVMYAWDYNGDGVYDDSSATAVSFDHAWQDLSADTTYTAKLQLRDDDGNFSTTTRAVHVVNYAPVLSLTSPTAYISIGDQITFTATFSDADQNLASTFLWDSDLNGSLNWGSPTDTATHTRQVTFPNAGTFMVRVQLSDTWGSVSDSIEVTVQTAPPEIPGCSTTVTAYILSPDVDFGTCGALDTAGGGGTIVMYKWDYNGDGVYDDSSASTSFLHHYADLSADTTYNARLLVRDDDGNNADKLVLVQVQNRAPTISGSPKITPVGVGDSAWVSFPTLNTTDLDGNGIDSLYWDENDDGSIDFRTIFTDSVLLPFSTSSPIMVSVSLRDRWAAADTMAFSMGGAACIGGSFYDNRDGTTYSCVTIGTQVWMSENLNYDTADGTGSWCYANLPANCTTYGRLYNWNTVMAGASTSSATPSGVRGVCPEGWHVPSDNEWEVMAQYVADQTGNNAKSNTTWTQLGVNLKATSGWSSGNGTDDFGFSALPAGYYYGSSFYDEGSNAYFWSAAEDDATYAWSRGLFSGNEYLLRSYYDKSYGFSSRCIQD